MKLFFSAIFDFFRSLLDAIIDFVHDHPVISSIIATAIVCFFIGFFGSKNHWQAPLKEKIAAHEKAIADRKLENAKISTDAKNAADVAALELIVQEQKILELERLYQSEKAKKNDVIYKMIDPRDPKKTINVQFNSRGQMICDRFSDAYMERVNAIIREGNSKK